MAPDYDGILNRWAPYDFKNGRSARNRVVVPPMASGTANVEGYATESTFKHYQNLSEAGAGIVFVEYTYVHRSGRSESHQLGLYADSQTAGHAEVSTIIKNSGSLAGIQLVHGGGKTSTDLTGGKLLGASSVAVPHRDGGLETPAEMTLQEIDLYQNWYLEAALRAWRSGYDIVELHCAHGYGLNQWLSPLTNQRTDEYGGDGWKRGKMLFEIFQKIRRMLPKAILGARIPGEDHFEGGLTPGDMFLIAKELEQLGADFLDVSSGIGGWKRPTDRHGEGYLLDDATAMQNQVAIPVIGVGGIESGSFVDQSIGERKVAFTAIGRKILKDPRAFFAEVMGTGP